MEPINSELFEIDFLPTNQLPCECQGTGILISTHDRSIEAAPCQQCTSDWNEIEARRRYADLLSLSHIPCGFMAARDTDDISPLVEEWYQNSPKERGLPTKSVFLCGPTATGKTFAAIALLFRFAHMGKSVRYVDCAEYLMDRRASYSAKHMDQIGETYTKKNERDRWSIARYDVVILDNIGVGTSNDWTKEQYDYLINSRETSGKLTIYISNYADDPKFSTDGKKLSTLIGNRPASRVGQATMLAMNLRSETEKSPDSVVFEPIKSPRPLASNETTFLHIWAREGLFSMVSKRDRSKLTAKSKVNGNEVIELPLPTPREYVSWSGYHVVLQGPVVDYEDANVLASLMRIYHTSGSSGTVSTTLGAILRELGLDPHSGAKQKQLKRSLVRLAESRITIRTIPDNPNVKSDEMMWIGGFFESVYYEGNTKNRRVIIKFNEAMAPFYQKKLLVMLPLDVLTSLTPYAQGIYRFLLGHRDHYKFISLARWREILAINPTVQDKSFRDCMRIAINELINRSLLTRDSHIDEKGVFHSFLARPIKEAVH